MTDTPTATADTEALPYRLYMSIALASLDKTTDEVTPHMNVYPIDAVSPESLLIKAAVNIADLIGAMEGLDAEARTVRIKELLNNICTKKISWPFLSPDMFPAKATQTARPEMIPVWTQSQGLIAS